MGALGSFLAQLTDNVHQQNERQRQEQLSANQQKAEMYKPILSNPNSTLAQRQEAAANIDKLLKVPGQTGGAFGKLHDFINQVHGHVAANAQAPATTPPFAPRQMQLGPPAVASAITGAPPTVTNELGDPVPSSAPSAATPNAPGSFPPLASSSPTTGASPKGLPPVSDSADPSAAVHPSVFHRIAHVAATAGHALASTLDPTAAPAGLADTSVQLKASDFPSPVPALPKWNPGLTPGSAVPEGASDMAGNPIDKTKPYHVGIRPGTGQTVYQQAAATPSGRSVPIARISASDAQRHAGEGKQFKDQDGNPIDVSKLAPTEMLVQVEGAKPGYVIASQNQRTINVGNQVYPVGSLDIVNAPNYSPSLGVAHPSTTGSRDQMVTDANTGETRVVSMGTSRQLPAPGMTAPRSLPRPTDGAPQSMPPIAPISTTPPASRSARPAASSAIPPTAPTARVPAPITAPSTAAGRLLPGVIPTGQAKGLRDRNTAINAFGTALENATKVVGPGGRTYADLFKDPAAIDRQANFLRLNNAVIENQYAAHVPDGITGAAEFFAGIPQSMLNTQNEDIKRAYAKLTPQDQHDIATYYNGVSHLGGTRKASGGLASQASMQTMLNDFPSALSDKSYEGAMDKFKNLYNEQNSYADPNLKANKVTFGRRRPRYLYWASGRRYRSGQGQGHEDHQGL